MVAPLVVAAVAGFAALAGGIAVAEGSKAIGEAGLEKNKERVNTLNGMVEKINTHVTKGELGSAQVVLKEAIAYSKEHSNLNQSTQALEQHLEKVEARIKTEIDKIEPGFIEEKKELLSDGDFGGVHRISQEFLGKLRQLLPPNSPRLQAYEKDYKEFSGPILNTN